MRITVKIGTTSLTNEHGALCRNKLAKHAECLAKACQEHEIILVTSASIASGFEKLGYATRPRDLPAKQACAAVGQGLLISAYSEEFNKYGITVAQALITRADFSKRSSCGNAKAALDLLLQRKALPIINENDLVAVEEINFGDNDTLSALISGLMQSELLIILTDQNGLYDKDPTEHDNAQLINEVKEISEEILASAGGTSKFGKGGMLSKLTAARLATSLGIKVFVGSGKLENHIEIDEVINSQALGTYFPASNSKLGLKKQWLAFHAPCCGKVFIDSGARDAILKNGHSLLPVGVQSIQGEFKKSDVIEAYCGETLIGRGVTNYSATQLKEILAASRGGGTKTNEELIHRDYWMPAMTGENE